MANINTTQRMRDLDHAFLDRYNLVGPRYTSYPTAPMWTEKIDAKALADHLDRTREGSAGDPLSIYVHIPFCRERCTFCACNVIVSRKMGAVTEPYLEHIEREAALYAARMDIGRPVIQFHWGGGTPTYLGVSQLRRLHGIFAERFNLAPDAEKSIEIHVTWTTDEQLRALADMGFNRLSMGVQDFDPRTQQAIGRRQSLGRTREVIALARELGFGGINIDLVYGLPYQTQKIFGETIERVIDMKPDRLALYNFAYLPRRLAHQRAIDSETLPPGEEKLAIFLEAHDRMTGAGYRYIGMDHFALPGDELSRAFDEGTMQRNFMGFTTRAGADLIGLGPSAIGSVAGLYAQNVKKLTEHGRAVETGEFPTERGCRLTPDDLLRRDVVVGLMCRDRVEKREIELRHKIDFDDYFADELDRLRPMVDDRLLTVTPQALELNFLGRVFVRNIAMVFDAYLKRPGARQPMFSRTL